jgi:hypothetical protein
MYGLRLSAARFCRVSACRIHREDTGLLPHAAIEIRHPCRIRELCRSRVDAGDRRRRDPVQPRGRRLAITGEHRGRGGEIISSGLLVPEAFGLLPRPWARATWVLLIVVLTAFVALNFF